MYLLVMKWLLCVAVLLPISCKIGKHLDRVKYSVDSVAVVNDNLSHVGSTYEHNVFRIDTSSYKAIVETFGYDSAVHRPYIKQRVKVSLKSGKDEGSNMTAKKDSTALSKNDSTSLASKTTEVHKQVVKRGLSLWYLLWLIPVGGFILIVRRYKSKIKLLGKYV